jgi:hypothetical protein
VSPLAWLQSGPRAENINLGEGRGRNHARGVRESHPSKRGLKGLDGARRLSQGRIVESHTVEPAQQVVEESACHVALRDRQSCQSGEERGLLIQDVVVLVLSEAQLRIVK